MEIRIFTDGSVMKNPGRGAYSTIIFIGNQGRRYDFVQGYRMTTNNRMELMPVIRAIKELKKIGIGETDNIIVYSDSKYVTEPFAQNWIKGWIAKDYRKVLNSDLWRIAVEEVKGLNIKFEWIRGHDNNFHNEECDRIAKKESLKGVNFIDDVWYMENVHSKIRSSNPFEF